MKSYTKLSIAIYAITIAWIIMILYVLYVSSEAILNQDASLIWSIFSIFTSGFLFHMFLSRIWKENKDKIFKIEEKTMRL